MDTITPLTSILPPISSTAHGRGRGQGQQPANQGQLLKALVLEAKGDNRFLLDIGGNRQTVSSEAALAPGQTLKLQVIRTEPNIELKIVSNPLNQLQGRSLTLLGKNIDLAALFQNFQQESSPPILSSTSRSILEDFYTLQQSGVEGKDGGIILKQLIDNLGLNMEQFLAGGDKNAASHTLKAALLEIAHSFDPASNIAETTHKILSTLELFQLTQLQIGHDTNLILPLPLPFIEQGYLLIEQGDKESKSGNTSQSENRFSLHLTVSELGNLQVDFLKNSEGLFIRFRAGDQEKADFLESFGPELKKAISQIPLISLCFSSDAPDPIHDLVRQLVPAGKSILDTRI